MKKATVFCLLLTTALVFAGCKKERPNEEPETNAPIVETEAQPEETEETETPETEEENTELNVDGKVTSRLTGRLVNEEIGNERPIAVMFNNIQDAIPQAGIANADVVYEVPVEGSLTRLMGILEDYRDLEKIGSIRSSRTYFVYFAREFDSLYVHYGQNDHAIPLLDLDETHNLNGMDGFSTEVFYRTSDREAPHNAYTSGAGLVEGTEDRGYRKEYDTDYSGHYKFAPEGELVMLESSAQEALTVYPGYSINQPYFSYSADGNIYQRYQYGAAHVDETTGEQLTYTNIIFQYVDSTADDKGVLTLDINNNSGEGKFITGGKAIDITWSKDSEWGVTKYYDASGSEITLNTGRTWVCVIQNSNVGNISITGESTASASDEDAYDGNTYTE